jgi:hypothetical protein
MLGFAKAVVIPWATSVVVLVAPAAIFFVGTLAIGVVAPAAVVAVPLLPFPFLSGQLLLLCLGSV